MATGHDLITLAARHIGETYDLGSRPPKDNANWKGPWDCAEFATWLVFQVSGKLYGCTDNTANPAAADAYTGGWDADVRARGVRVSLDEAAATEGAFLLRPPGVGGRTVGHIALSDGTGGTIEAMDRKHGVCRGSVHQRSFTLGVRVPWVTCAAGAPVPVTRPARLVEGGATGATVRAIQVALAAAGFDPGTIDGAFGPHTEAAIVAFQLARGLVADVVVGPKTAAALGVSL